MKSNLLAGLAITVGVPAIAALSAFLVLAADGAANFQLWLEVTGGEPVTSSVSCGVFTYPERSLTPRQRAVKLAAIVRQHRRPPLDHRNRTAEY